MKRLFLLIALATCSISAFGQGVRYQNVALVGGGVSHAQIRVCTEPASGSVCTPLASVFSNKALTLPLANPFSADTNGNYFFYASVAVTYHVQIFANGTLIYEQPDISLATPGSVVLQTNGVTNSSQSLLNLAAGTNITLTNVAGVTTINSSANLITLQTNGVNNTSQILLNLIAGTNTTLSNVGGGVTINSTAAPITLQTNTVNNASQTLLNLIAGTNTSLVNSGGNVTVNATPTATAVGSSGRFWMIFGDITTCPIVIGNANAPITRNLNSNGCTKVGSTGTEPPGTFLASTASASLNIEAGIERGWGAGLGSDDMSWGPLLRFSHRVLLGNSGSITNARYWVGGTDGATGDITGGSGLATNTPNRVYAMFRRVAGTDTNIQACTGRSNVLQTCTDTGVAPDTVNSMLFEILPVEAVLGTITGFTFYLNGALVATNTTNIPTATDRFGTCVLADNENTATAVAFTFYSTMVTLR